jgi:quercetin dioxygenase-like cupin family protein
MQLQITKEAAMKPFTNVVKADEGTLLDLMGPKLEFLTSEEYSFCVMKGTISPGQSVPLHSHEDAETFYVLSGEAHFFLESGTGFAEQTLRQGDFVQIPGAAKHAWHNRSLRPFEVINTVTPRLGRALREMGRPVVDANGRFTPQGDIRRLVEVSARYGYWLGTPEENAQLGISLSSGL